MKNYRMDGRRISVAIVLCALIARNLFDHSLNANRPVKRDMTAYGLIVLNVGSQGLNDRE